jgi:membrane fusion protein (multidrug efflux system)
MSKTLIRILSLVLAAAVLLGGWYWLRRDEPSGEPADEGAAAPAPPPSASDALPVDGVVVRPRPLQEQITVNGSTLAPREVMVSSEVSGLIQDILFKEGSYVQKGAPLVQLDIEELETQRKRLEVEKRLTAGIAERFRGLYEKEGVSLQDYENAQAEAEQAVANLELVEVQIEKRTIRAPFSGRLGLKMVSEGSYIAPGTPIVPLVSINPIQLEFAVPEKYAAALRMGKTVYFETEATDAPRKATITARDPSIDTDTRTLRFKAEAPNPNGRLLPGTFAKVNVILQSFDEALMIPTQAVIPELGGKKVFLARRGTAHAVPVETGIRREKTVQVVDGVVPGDTVITTGMLQLREGAPIRIGRLDKG